VAVAVADKVDLLLLVAADLKIFNNHVIIIL
jgi:hypothetical protein